MLQKDTYGSLSRVNYFEQARWSGLISLLFEISLYIYSHKHDLAMKKHVSG